MKNVLNFYLTILEFSDYKTYCVNVCVSLSPFSSMSSMCILPYVWMGILVPVNITLILY